MARDFSDVLELMPFTVTVRPFSGQDQYNDPDYGPAVTYRCLIEEKTRLVATANGTQQPVDTTLYLGSADDVPVDSLVTLPDGKQRRVTAVSRAADADGWAVTTLYL